MPSDKPKTLSTEAHGDQSTDSVFDFLYYDATRIASFLSQFDSSGHLTTVTQGERAHRSKQENTALKTEGSIAVAKGAVTRETDRGAEYGRESQRIYDPRWANALAFLDYLDERRLLHRELESARIGQIVLFSGELSLFDLGVLRRMWDLPAVKKMILNAAGNQQPNEHGGANRQERRKLAASDRAKASSLPNEAELALELLTILPHAVQAAISTDFQSVWASLKEENLTIAAADLFMKHGLTIAGDWNVVGILDALPDEIDYQPADGEAPLSALKQMVAGSKLGFFGFSMAPHLVPPVRQLLGRPSTSYGFTPLLLFREIAA